MTSKDGDDRIYSIAYDLARELQSKGFLSAETMDAVGVDSNLHKTLTKALPLHATQECVCPLLVVHAGRNAQIVPEIELCNVPMQMLFGAMLIHALHTAFEDGVVGLQRDHDNGTTNT